MSELLGGQSELIKRVDELRSLYRLHREELGDGFSALRSRGAFGPIRKDDDVGHAPATRSQDDSSSDEDEKRAKRAAMAAALRAKYFMDNVDAVQLQTVVRQMLAEHGGSAHLDTVVEYVRMRWPNLRRRDGSHYSVGDFRKLTLNCLRTHRRTFFAPDRYHENCFALFHGGGETPADGPSSPAGDDAQELEDEADDNRDTLANALIKCLEAKGAIWAAPLAGTPQPNHAAGLLADDLCAAVVPMWTGHTGLDADEAREAIRFTIATNPRIKKDPRRADALLATPRRARTLPVESTGNGANGGADRGGGGARGEWKRRRGKAEEGDEEASNNDQSEDEPRARTARRGGRAAGPSSANAANVLSAKSGGALAKRREANSGRGEKEKEEKNPWIQCDGCHRWVQARSDNIEDISLYDDANPDHLDYYCPRCRKKRGTDANAPGADDVSDGGATRGGRAKAKRGGARVAQAEESAEAELAALSGAAGGDGAPTRRSTRAKGGKKRSAEEEEEEEGEGEEEGKLEQMERTLLDEFEEEKETRHASLAGEPERLAAVRTLEKKFEEEATKYKATLVHHRNAAWERNARDADAADVELLDDKAEEELAAQLKDWFEKRRAKLRAHIDETLHDA